MKIVTALAALVAGLAYAGVGGANAADKHDDRQDIVGTWKYISFTESGERRDVPEGMRVVITNDTFTIRRPGQDSTGTKYTLDPSTNPKQIDFVVELDPGRPIRQPGIYELTVNRLRIHSAAAGTPRPKDFQPVPRETGGVMVLERVPNRKDVG